MPPSLQTPEANGAPARKSVFITGASTGIGAASAAWLAKRGWRVFAGVRNSSDGDRLREAYEDRIEPVLIDLRDGTSIEGAAGAVAERLKGGGLHGLINNAGVTVTGPMECIPLPELRGQIEVNFTGQVAVTQAFLPLIRAGQGRIVNMSSIFGRIASPFVGPYHASKYALEAFNDTLRMELRPWGIHVVCIEPGNVATPIWSKASSGAKQASEALTGDARTLYGERYANFAKSTMEIGRQGVAPERVARTAARALEARKPRPRYLVGWDARLLLAASWVLPARWMDAAVIKLAIKS